MFCNVDCRCNLYLQDGSLEVIERWKEKCERGNISLILGGHTHGAPKGGHYKHILGPSMR